MIFCGKLVLLFWSFMNLYLFWNFDGNLGSPECQFSNFQPDFYGKSIFETKSLLFWVILEFIIFGILTGILGVDFPILSLIFG